MALYDLGPRPSWRALLDAYARLLVERIAARDAEEATEDLVEAVAALPADDDGRAPSLLDMGRMLGRHVHSKAIGEDDLKAALEDLNAELRGGGYGGLEVGEVFHRRARVGFSPGSAWEDAAVWAVSSWVGGILTGALEVAFNCQVDINTEAAYRFEVRLGEGRDVNQEATSLGGDPREAAGDD